LRRIKPDLQTRPSFIHGFNGMSFAASLRGGIREYIREKTGMENTVSEHGNIEIGSDHVVLFSGSWTLYYLADLERQIADRSWPPATEIVWELSGIEAIDTSGAWLLQRTVNELKAKGRSVRLRGLSSEVADLLETVASKWPGSEATKAATRGSWLETIGRLVWDSGPRSRAALAFLGESSATSLSLVTHPAQVRWRVLMHNLQLDGFNALPITGLLTFLMGVVIAYQGSEQLKTFGANIFIVDLVGISLLREIAPLVTAILVAGRSGSAYTAQIGTMRVTEELDALRALGVSPMALLVFPRALALFIALPLLTVFADVLGVVGGMLIAWNQLGITFTEFLARFENAIALKHYLIGIGKTPVFAVIIALVGCYQGLQVVGGVDSVGRHTTISVVQGIFLVIVTDAFFSVLFSWWGV
jgi:phospholipid/cholesterol/gamma-HCH transport system permease protein